MKVLRPTATEHLFLTAGALHDGTGSPLRQDVTVCIRDGLIRAIVPRDEGCRACGNPLSTCGERLPPGTSRHVVCPDLTLLPGLVDCHVHLALPRRASDAPEAVSKAAVRRLAACAGAGVLAVRDGGDPLLVALKVRDGFRKSPATGPGVTVLAAGAALFRAGRYGALLGWGVSGREELEKTLRRLLALGVDHIKVVASGLVDFAASGRLEEPPFPERELAWLVDAAHAAGVPVMAHVNSPSLIAAAVAAGVDTIEHGFGMEPATLEEMAWKEILWVPTVTPVARLLRHRRLDPVLRRSVARTLSRHLASIATAAVVGVPLGVGTDAGAPGVQHGAAFKEELVWLARAGVPAAHLIRAACTPSVVTASLGEWAGSLTPGRLARLVGVEGNPVRDPVCLSRVRLACIPAVS